jgi:hypothetical protein
MPPKTQREREEAWRKAKLDRMQEQIDEGSLTVRQMTDEERQSFERAREDRPTRPVSPAQRERATRARERRKRTRAS